MKVRKLGAILLAGSLATTSAAAAINTIPVVNAATEEENMVDLLTAELPDANVMNDFASLGDGFCLFNTKEGGTALVHLEKGENGELTYSNIKTDVELSKWKFGASNNERFVLSNADGKKRIMSLDKKNKEAKTVYTFESSRCTITDDNYVVFESDDNKISVIKPDGTKIETDKTIEIKSDVANLIFNPNGKEYIAYYMDIADANTSYKIYGLNREGKWTEAISTPKDWLEQKIGSFENTLIGSLGFFTTNGNYILIAAFLKGTDGSPYAQPQYDFIDLSTNTLTVLSSKKTGYFSVIDKNGILSDYAYGSLFNPRTQEYLENGYQPHTLDDGETYCICADDSWDEYGLVDENNNFISKVWYDSASPFCGDYAPVVKDGMGYLIDKKGNCVSEKIPAKTATTLGENLYRFGCTLVYVDGSTTSVKPDDNSSNSGTSSGTGSDSSNSGTSSGTGSDSGNSGTSSGTGSDSSNSGTNSGTGSDSGNSGTNSGTGSDSSNSGTSSGTGSDSSNSGTSSGTGSDSGNSGTNSGTGSNSNSGTSSDSSTSNSGADKENADTGFGGIAMTLGIVALAGAAIVVAKKKH